jgi:hypothetical protein
LVVVVVVVVGFIYLTIAHRTFIGYPSEPSDYSTSSVVERKGKKN